VTTLAQLIPEQVKKDLREGVRTAAHCTFCGVALPSLQLAWRKVEGFTQPRKQGGTNALRLRRELDVYACTTCVDKAARGIDPQQGSLT
jgi:hypothetical protein